jgi:hypothetical protein
MLASSTVGVKDWNLVLATSDIRSKNERHSWFYNHALIAQDVTQADTAFLALSFQAIEKQALLHVATRTILSENWRYSTSKKREFERWENLNGHWRLVYAEGGIRSSLFLDVPGRPSCAF